MALSRRKPRRGDPEPREAVGARNLLSKQDWRAALRCEAEHLGPEVSVILGSLAPSGAAERLARAAPRPDLNVVGPPGACQRRVPDAYAREKVNPLEAVQVPWRHVVDRALIHEPICDVPRRDQVS